MQDEYARLANRFRLGGHLDLAELVRLWQFAGQHRNYLLFERVGTRLLAS